MNYQVIPPLGGLRQAEKDYWYYKELYMRLPSGMRFEMIKNNKNSDFKTAVKKFLKGLPKLEQLIYTNEIQGE